MTRYINTKVNISEGQKEKLQHAIEANCSAVSIRLGHEDLRGNDIIAITESQAKKLAKAYENGKGITIRMSSRQLKHNKKVEGGFLGLLAGLAIIIDNEKFMGTPVLWNLIMLKEPPNEGYTQKEYEDYIKILLKTHVLHQGNNPNNPYPKSSKGYKWNRFLSTIWENRGIDYEGKGIVIMSSDPNALLERLDLLLSSQKAGHTGVGNELVSICDKLKRQGVLDTDAYKKLNSIIKNDST